MHIIITGPARKDIRRLPENEKTRILPVIEEISRDIFGGDIKKLTVYHWRRRVGNFRIFFKIDHENNCLYILGIKRRTSVTY